MKLFCLMNKQMKYINIFIITGVDDPRICEVPAQESGKLHKDLLKVCENLIWHGGMEVGP